MMKWLRKHRKRIMVGVVLFAMFSFVGGAALQGILSPDPFKETAMSVFGDAITHGDIRQAGSDTELLQRGLLLDWKQGSEKLTVYHWLMLAKEAERAGIVVSDKEVEAFIDRQDNFRAQCNLGPIRDYAVDSQISMARIREVARRHLSINKNFQRVFQAPMPSEPQIRHYVRDTQDKVAVRLVTFDSSRFIDNDIPVTDAELQAQFDKYRDEDPETNVDGFGYRYPERVKIQYVSAQVLGIQGAIEIDQDEAIAHWRKNQSKYKKTIEVPAPPTSMPAVEGPTSQPEPPPAQPTRKQVEMKFSEARASVERELRLAKARTLARRAMSKLAEELSEPWIELKAGDDGYKPIPDAARDPNFMKAACDRVSKRFGITLTYNELPLSTSAKLKGEPALRNAKTPGEAPDQVALDDLAFRVPQFFEVPKDDGTLPCLQLFQTPTTPLVVSGRPSFNFELRRSEPGLPENFVLFRVLEARDSEPPATLDEVRTKVDYDIRASRAFESMKPMAEEFAFIASRLGLDSALTYFDDVGKKYGLRNAVTLRDFARWTELTNPDDKKEKLLAGESVLEPPTLNQVGKSQRFVEACFEMADEAWTPDPIGDPGTERTQRATTQPSESPPKIRLVSLPNTRKRFVVELSKSTPVNTESYQTLRSGAFSSLLLNRMLLVRDSWYDVDQIEKRCDYEPVTREDDPTES